MDLWLNVGDVITNNGQIYGIRYNIACGCGGVKVVAMYVVDQFNHMFWVA